MPPSQGAATGGAATGGQAAMPKALSAEDQKMLDEIKASLKEKGETADKIAWIAARVLSPGS